MIKPIEVILIIIILFTTYDLYDRYKCGATYRKLMKNKKNSELVESLLSAYRHHFTLSPWHIIVYLIGAITIVERII
tara:strand:+ start:1023 stop:1253 length:231 start_codon:yes stop_codon:yes gene_type:complete